ncbi:hypothetical protein DB34_09275 [Acetobacter pasteurianus]|nr:hypothetical protein DB34_09275 [Acetobacter pasteurianus]
MQFSCREHAAPAGGMQPLCCIIRVSYLLYGRHTKMYVAKLHQFAARLPVVGGGLHSAAGVLRLHAVL